MRSAVPGRQRGAALMTALVMLTILTLVTLSTLRLTMEGLRIAANEELRLDAFQNAQSMIDGTLDVAGNLALTLDPGEANCLPSDGDASCVLNSLALPGGTPSASPEITVRAVRLGPELVLPPRGTNFSARRFRAAVFRIESTFDWTRLGWGRESLAEGVASIVPQYGQ